eukprot:763107_1
MTQRDWTRTWPSATDTSVKTRKPVQRNHLFFQLLVLHLSVRHMKLFDTTNGVQNILLLYCVISTTYLLSLHIDMDKNEALRHPYHRRNLLSTKCKSCHNEDTTGNELSVGSILLWGGNTSDIPSNWKLCDGNDNTPNLTDKFVIGAGNGLSMHSTGGQRDITLQTNQLPIHNHLLINDSIIIEESDGDEHYHDVRNTDMRISTHNGHAHVVSSDNISINGNHSHGVGSYVLSDSGEHAHYIRNNNTQITQSNHIEVDLSTVNVATSGSHTHTWSGSTNTAGNHQHDTHNLILQFYGQSGGIPVSPGVYAGSLGTYAGSHSHSVSGSTSSSGQHTHSMIGSLNITNFSVQSSGEHDHIIKGRNSRNGAHKHELFTESSHSGEHSHSVYGQTDWSYDNHSHEVIFGETDSIGNGENIDILNPYYALAFIIKVSISQDTDTTSGWLQQTSDSVMEECAIIFSVLSLFFVLVLCFTKIHQCTKRMEKEDEIKDSQMNRELSNDNERKGTNMDLSAKHDCAQPDTYNLSSKQDGCAQPDPDVLDGVFDGNVQSILTPQPIEDSDYNGDDVVRSINKLLDEYAQGDDFDDDDSII